MHLYMNLKLIYSPLSMLFKGKLILKNIYENYHKYYFIDIFMMKKLKFKLFISSIFCNKIEN